MPPDERPSKLGGNYSLSQHGHEQQQQQLMGSSCRESRPIGPDRSDRTIGASKEPFHGQLSYLAKSNRQVWRSRICPMI